MILLSKIILIEVFNELQSYYVFDKNILNSILFVRIVRKLFTVEEIEFN
jgi:hypothetical protein